MRCEARGRVLPLEGENRDDEKEDRAACSLVEAGCWMGVVRGGHRSGFPRLPFVVGAVKFFGFFAIDLDLVCLVAYSARNGFCRAPGLCDSLSRRAQACVLVGVPSLPPPPAS